MKRSRYKRNRFSILLPAISVIAIAGISILSSFYEKSWSYNWENTRQAIKDSMQVAKWNVYTFGSGPNSRSNEEQANTRSWIMNNATIEELTDLLEYPDGTLKGIAYEGLIRRREYKDKKNLLLRSIKDTEYVVYIQGGCVASGMEISQYLIEIAFALNDNLPPFRKGQFRDHGLTEMEKEEILSAFYGRKAKSED